MVSLLKVVQWFWKKIKKMWKVYDDRQWTRFNQKSSPVLWPRFANKSGHTSILSLCQVLNFHYTMTQVIIIKTECRMTPLIHTPGFFFQKLNNWGSFWLFEVSIRGSFSNAGVHFLNRYVHHSNICNVNKKCNTFFHLNSISLWIDPCRKHYFYHWA